MMQESLIGEFCRPSLDHRRYQRRIPAALPGTVGALSVGTLLLSCSMDCPHGFRRMCLSRDGCRVALRQGRSRR
jgi:hypothetical protein